MSMTEPAMGMEHDTKRHEIQQRMLRHWYKVHPDFGAAVEKGISGVQQKAADGNPVASTNVIVQLCTVTVNTHDVDVEGNPSQYTHSIGNGTVVIFRNGKRINGTWSRASATAGTIYKDASGTPIALAPGNTFIVLATTGTAVTSS